MGVGASDGAVQIRLLVFVSQAPQAQLEEVTETQAGRCGVPCLSLGGVKPKMKPRGGRGDPREQGSEAPHGILEFICLTVLC